MIKNEVEEIASTVILVGAPEGTVIRDIHTLENMQYIKNTSTYEIQSYLALMKILIITYTGTQRMCPVWFAVPIVYLHKVTQCAVGRNYTG